MNQHIFFDYMNFVQSVLIFFWTLIIMTIVGLYFFVTRRMSDLKEAFRKVFKEKVMSNDGENVDDRKII